MAQGRSALEDQDLTAARDAFLAAYAADPSNKDARTGVALTKLVLLFEDPDVIAAVEDWGAYAPTVENLIYNVLSNQFEVYGSNTPYCGDDPAKAGLAKLTTSSASSPYIYGGSYAYYIVRTGPFSQITIDEVAASSGNAPPGNAYCFEGNVSSLFFGTVGDGISVIMGGKSLTGSTLTVRANPGATSATITTIGSSQGTKPAIFAKPGSPAGTSTAAYDPLGRLRSLVRKLPKGSPTLLQRAGKVLAATIPANAPTVSETQAVIDNKVLPVLADVIAKLRPVEGTGYTFTITPPMTGGAEVVDTVLDDGEFYGLDALVSGVRALLNVVTAYNLDVDYALVDIDPLSMLNGPAGGLTSTVDATKFFTLRANGAAKMADALSGLQDAAERAALCYAFVFNEWGYAGTPNLLPTKDPLDNGLRWDTPSDPTRFTVDDDRDIKAALDGIRLALQDQVTVSTSVSGGIESMMVSNGTSTVTLSSRSTPSAPDRSDSLLIDLTKHSLRRSRGAIFPRFSTTFRSTERSRRPIPCRSTQS